MSETQKDRKMSEYLVKTLLNKSAFSGFSFDTSFTLRFCREGTTKIGKYRVPSEIEIVILTEWWFGTKKEWNEKLQQHIATMLCHNPEPQEPVQAYELTSLRWSEGALVEKIDFYENYMSIAFSNLKVISISFESDEDWAWIIRESNVSEVNSEWSVVCEGGEFFVRMPFD